MRYSLLLRIVVFSVLILGYFKLAALALEETKRAHQQERLYEATRAELEALYRTRGYRSINSAYICQKR